MIMSIYWNDIHVDVDTVPLKWYTSEQWWIWYKNIIKLYSVIWAFAKSFILQNNYYESLFQTYKLCLNRKAVDYCLETCFYMF